MYSKDEFTIYNTQFTNRLEVSDNGTKLRIKHLRMEDTGVYTAVMTFKNGDIRQVQYVLAVYDLPYGRYFCYLFFILLLTALLVRMGMEGRKGHVSISSVWAIFVLNTIGLLTFILVIRLTRDHV